MAAALDYPPCRVKFQRLFGCTGARLCAETAVHGSWVVRLTPGKRMLRWTEQHAHSSNILVCLTKIEFGGVDVALHVQHGAT